MKYRVRYTKEARDDLKRLYAFLLARDLQVAKDALAAIIKAVDSLRGFPFTARRAPGGDAFLRELIIPFASAGYVALFQIKDATTVNILAVRHQREDDYR